MIPLPIPGLETYYRIDMDGRIWSERLGAFVRHSASTLYGNRSVSLRGSDGVKRWYSVAKLVAVSFLGMDSGSRQRIFHLDGDNGNNSAGNLAFKSADQFSIFHRNKEEGVTWGERPDGRYAREREVLVVEVGTGVAKEYGSVREVLKEYPWLSRRQFNRLVGREVRGIKFWVKEREYDK